MVKNEDLLDIIVQTCEDRKAQNTLVLDIKDNSSIADYFVITSGTSNPQTAAIANGIISALEEIGVERINSSGFENPKWIILDYGDIVVHVFHENEREYYDLERLWEEFEN